jgi:hypothetical protein
MEQRGEIFILQCVNPVKIKLYGTVNFPGHAVSTRSDLSLITHSGL